MNCDVILTILYHCDGRDLLACAASCRQWRALVEWTAHQRVKAVTAWQWNLAEWPIHGRNAFPTWRTLCALHERPIGEWRQSDIVATGDALLYARWYWYHHERDTLKVVQVPPSFFPTLLQVANGRKFSKRQIEDFWLRGNELILMPLYKYLRGIGQASIFFEMALRQLDSAENPLLDERINRIMAHLREEDER